MKFAESRIITLAKKETWRIKCIGHLRNQRIRNIRCGYCDKTINNKINILTIKYINTEETLPGVLFCMWKLAKNLECNNYKICI